MPSDANGHAALDGSMPPLEIMLGRGFDVLRQSRCLYPNYSSHFFETDHSEAIQRVCPVIGG